VVKIEQIQLCFSAIMAEMLNIDAFRKLCLSVVVEKDTAKLEDLKDALRLMLLSEGMHVHHVEKSPGSKPN
jgi:hypothetical protein